MCRSDVPPEARDLLGHLLSDIAAALAAQSGVDRTEVRIGPVDFGYPPTRKDN